MAGQMIGKRRGHFFIERRQNLVSQLDQRHRDAAAHQVFN